MSILESRAEEESEQEQTPIIDFRKFKINSIILQMQQLNKQKKIKSSATELKAGFPESGIQSRLSTLSDRAATASEQAIHTNTSVSFALEVRPSLGDQAA
jgi:hypothetical protein